jgi:Ankyrin repeats (3 copies)
MDVLNDDVLSHILTFVDKNEVIFLKETCKIFYEALKNFRTQFPKKTLVFSDIKFLDWAIDHEYKIEKKKMFVHAIKYGHKPKKILQYLMDEIDHCSRYLTPKLHALAIEKGQISTLQWLIKNRCRYDSKIFDAFAPLEIYNWVFENYVWNEKQLSHIIEEDKLEKLKWVLDSLPFLSDFVCDIAAECNSDKILKWSVRNRFPYGEDTIANCALNGNLKMIKFLHKNKCRSNQWVIANACAKGHLNVVKWCLKNKYEIGEYALIEAENNGHHDIFDYLNEFLMKNST